MRMFGSTVTQHRRRTQHFDWTPGNHLQWHFRRGLRVWDQTAVISKDDDIKGLLASNWTGALIFRVVHPSKLKSLYWRGNSNIRLRWKPNRDDQQDF